MLIDIRCKLIGSQSKLETTYTGLLQACDVDRYVGVSVQGSSVGGDVLDDNLLVVVELLSSACDHVATIDGDLQVVEHCVISVEQRVALSI